MEHSHNLDEIYYRKQRTMTRLKLEGVPVHGCAPLTREARKIKAKGDDALLKRMLCSFFTIQVAFDLYNDQDLQVSRKYHYRNLCKFGVQNQLNRKEHAFFFGKRPSQKDIVDTMWKYEANWLLLWVLGFIDQLKFPCETCDVLIMLELTQKTESYASLYSRIERKTVDELLDMADYLYHVHQVIRDAREHGCRAPANINAAVVVERRRAIEWLLSPEQEDWNDILLNA